jgi:hypothetical protein
MEEIKQYLIENDKWEKEISLGISKEEFDIMGPSEQDIKIEEAKKALFNEALENIRLKKTEELLKSEMPAVKENRTVDRNHQDTKEQIPYNSLSAIKPDESIENESGYVDVYQPVLTK